MKLSEEQVETMAQCVRENQERPLGGSSWLTARMVRELSALTGLPLGEKPEYLANVINHLPPADQKKVVRATTRMQITIHDVERTYPNIKPSLARYILRFVDGFQGRSQIKAYSAPRAQDQDAD